jgi:NADH-quinone oxidoreductase subunit G
MQDRQMIKIIIDDKEISVPIGINLIQACEVAGSEIPRFCYHDRLKIAGNCRMCLVEVINPKGPPKPVASCAVEVSDGMVVSTKSEMVKKARGGVMEFLLANHPLDCPVCDQAGECDLQDQAFVYGKNNSRYNEEKRIVEDKNMGALIRTNMTRCIHCTRCSRFIEDIAGTAEIGAFGRGENMEISTFLEQNVTSELSGNIIDLCPVGALTSKPFSYTARSWELEKTDTIDVMDAVGSNIRVDSRGFEVMRILPRINEQINEEWISDVARFSYDGLKYQRIDKAYIDGTETRIDLAIDKAKKLINKNTAVIIGDLVDVETAFMTKKLIEKFDIKNYTCIQDGAKIDVSNRQNYLFNTGIENIPQADFILLVGTNPKLEAPIVNMKIRQAFLNGAKIFGIGINDDLHYKYQILSNDCLLDIYKGKACEELKNAKKPMIIVGQDAIKTSEIMQTVLAIGQKYCVKENWNGYNMLHKVAGRVGALDVGLSGVDIDDILQKCQNGEIKTVLAIGCDEVKIKNANVIYIGTHGEEVAQNAKIILPASCYTEKTVTFVNTEGLAQKTYQAVPKIGDCMNDCEIVAMLCDDYTKISQITKNIVYNYSDNMQNFEAFNCTIPDINNDIKKLYMSNCISRSSVVMAKRITELKKH